MDRDDREQRNHWLQKYERWTELPLTILALLLIPILIGPVITAWEPRVLEVVDDIGYLIWGIFAADLVIKLAIVPDRQRYLRTHWFDVVLVLVWFLRPLRVLRALRLLSSFAAAARVAKVGRTLLTRHQLHYALLLAMLIVVFAGSLVTAAERNAEGANITSLPDGLWWAVTTVSTVGYGDTYPTTAAGRGIGVALMLLGVALFGVITANLASFLSNKTKAVRHPNFAQ